jgi:hypothetical protein
MQQQLQLLEEDTPNNYTIFNMITSQYNNHDFTTGQAQTILPTLVPEVPGPLMVTAPLIVPVSLIVLIAEPSSHESNKITNILEHSKINTTALPVAIADPSSPPPIYISNRVNKGKKPQRYGDNVI